MTPSILRFLFFIFSILFLQSCSSKILGVNVNEQKTSYAFIKINSNDYLVRVIESEGVIAYRENNECEQLQSSIPNSEVRLINRGLALSHLSQVNKKGQFYLDQEIIFNAYGKAVLSRIVDTNLELSENEKFAIHYHLLQTRLDLSDVDLSCYRFRTEFKSDIYL